MSVDRYGFLASAIAGRSVTLQRATRGNLAYSDGQSIFLPLLADEAGNDAWSAVAAQAALIGAGSLHAALLGQLLGRPITAQRYLYLEILRAAHVLADRLPWGFTARAELRAPPLSGSAQGSLDLASTRHPLPDPPDYFGRIRPLLGVRSALSEQGLAALSRKPQPGEITTIEVAALDDDDAGESSRLLRLFRNPLAIRNPLFDLVNGILGAGISKTHRDTETGGGEGGAELPVGRLGRAVRRGIRAIRAKLPALLPDLELPAVSPTFRYPEWDVHEKRYRRDWVLVEQCAAWREDAPAVARRPEFEHRLGPAGVELRRQLSGLGLDQEIHGRQNDGSDVDLDALIECVIELRACNSPATPQVYRTSRRTRRDLAITLVVDISGSTGEQPHGTLSIFKKQLQVAYQLGHVLDSLGDTVAIFAFHSWGRKRVRVVRIKDQAERWSMRVAERMALLEPVGYTRIGAAIRHGTHVLRDRIRLPHRLLVLISDGIAYDQDYELSYAAADANRALAEARAAGTACVCLSVGSGTDTQTLKEVFGAANLLAVDEVSEVPARIRDVCRHALASVSISPRRQASRFS